MVLQFTACIIVFQHPLEMDMQVDTVGNSKHVLRNGWAISEQETCQSPVWEAETCLDK